MMSRFLSCPKPRLGVIVAAGAAMFVSAAVAVGATGDTLEEVVVTSQRREQNIQQVPIAISAFTADALQSKGLSDIHALSNLTPNVNLDGGSPFSGDSSVLSASIRGIGQDDFAFNLDPAVGVYLDGVYLARTIGANQNLLDVDRIEILKGPQGTLFGRNTIGGAINIVTHTPGTEPKVVGAITTGSWNRLDAQLMVDLPISSQVLTTFSASSQTQGGWQHVVPYPADSVIGQTPYQVMGQADMPKAPGSYSSNTGGGKNIQVLRGKVLVHASNSLDVTIAGDWTHQNQPGLPNTILSVGTSNATSYVDPGVQNFPAAFGELFGAPGIFGNLYNACITTPTAALNPFPGAPFNTTNGLCGPLGVGTWNSTTNSFRGNGFTGGVPALGGAGAVGVPNSVLQGLVAAYPNVAPFVTVGANGVGSVLYPGKTPRLYWNFPNTQTGSTDTTYANGPSFAKSTAWGTSLTFDWNISDSMKFKSITGLRQIIWDVGTDLDGVTESMQEVTDEQEQRQFSQEFQLTGKALDNRLDYMVGLYYFTESGYVHDYVPFDTAYLWIYDYQNDVKTDSYAAFAHVDYNFNDAFGITLGARYSKEKKQFQGGQGDLNGFSYKISGCLDPYANANTYVGAGFGGVPAGVTCQQVLGFPDPSNPLRYFPPGWDHQTWGVFTPTAGLQYHFDRDMMLYASYSKGFKSGGWTTRLSNPILDSSKARFDPEYDNSYELGWKSQWLNHHLQANLAFFYSEYKGIQINVQEGPSPVYQNAGDAKIKGVELELQSIFDNGFGLAVNAGYMDAYYTYLNPCLVYNNCDPAQGPQANPITGGFSSDSKLPKTPKYKVAISPSYDARLPNGSSLRLMADYTMTAELFNDGLNTPLLKRPSTHILDASIHWLPPGSEKYEVIVGGTNLTNERYITVGSINYAAGEVVGSYNQPHAWYATLRAKF
jgi:iron complex outermembrane recepter protein